MRASRWSRPLAAAVDVVSCCSLSASVRCWLEHTCTVSGPAVIDSNGRVNSVQDRCAHSLMLLPSVPNFHVLANFQERRRKDVSFLDSVTLRLDGPRVDIHLQQGGRVQVSYLQPQSRQCGLWSQILVTSSGVSALSDVSVTSETFILVPVNSVCFFTLSLCCDAAERHDADPQQFSSGGLRRGALQGPNWSHCQGVAPRLQHFCLL